MDHRLDTNKPPVPIIWWVAFCNATDEARGWWDIFTRPDFEHCFAFRQVVDDVVLTINPLRRHMNIDITAGLPIDYIRQLKESGHRVLVVEIPPNDYNRRRGPLTTCAAIVGYVMGLDSPSITPYSLYKRLIKHYHAEDLTDE